MREFIDRIVNSEFISSRDSAKVKVLIVNIFITGLLFLNFSYTAVDISLTLLDIHVFLPAVIGSALVLSFLLLLSNFNRIAMHVSIIASMVLVYYYLVDYTSLYGYMLFYVSIIMIVFFQDIVTYLLYATIITIAGYMYIDINIISLLGDSQLSHETTEFTYKMLLIAFYSILLVQVLVSQYIIVRDLKYRWAKIDTTVQKYYEDITDILTQTSGVSDDIVVTEDFKSVIMETSLFIGAICNAKNIEETVNLYFNIQENGVDVVLDTVNSRKQRKKIIQLDNYQLNKHSEMRELLYTVAITKLDTAVITAKRYAYKLSDHFDNFNEKIIAIAILYKYTKETVMIKLKTKYRLINHKEIVELFHSSKFRNIIDKEQLMFFVDNQDIFKKTLI